MASHLWFLGHIIGASPFNNQNAQSGRLEEDHFFHFRTLGFISGIVGNFGPSSHETSKCSAFHKCQSSGGPLTKFLSTTKPKAAEDEAGKSGKSPAKKEKPKRSRKKSWTDSGDDSDEEPSDGTILMYPD